MSAMAVSISFIVFLAIAIPIGSILAMLSFLPHMLDPWFPADGPYIIRSMISGINSFPILAVPMFILSGNIMARGGISEKLFKFFSYFVIKRRAGLPMAMVVTCLFYGAISGSGPATTAAVGAMTIPILERLGYDKVFATALMAVAGGLGVVIPPSIPFIFYGQTANVSVGKLFVAGVIPGLLIGACLMAYAYYYCWKHGEDQEKLEAYSKEIRKHGFINLTLDSFWALLSPLIILGSIYMGIASPTEAAVISVFYSLFISVVIYKSISWEDVYQILKESVKTYSTILFIIAAAVSFARILTFMEIPMAVANFIGSVVSDKIMYLILVNIILFLVGMIMDTTPAILVLTPILMPIANMYNIDPVHFGIIMVVNLAIGFVTPPLGINLFVASALAKVEFEAVIRQVIPFIGVFVLALIAITFIPGISLWILGR